MASPHAYRFSIGENEFGDNNWTFEVNPVDAEGLFPRRPQAAISVIDGADMLQFSEDDTRLRSFRFDTMRGAIAAEEEFLLGDDEADTESLLYLKYVDENGQLTTYWLNIPEPTLRPYGYRAYEWIPIRVEDVHTLPSRDGLKPRWEAELYFTVLPPHQAPYTFTLGFSQLGSQNELISDQIEKVYFYDQSLSSYTDYTDEAYEGGTPFPSVNVAAGDMMYYGCKTTHYGAWKDMDTVETVEPDPEQGGTPHVRAAWTGSWETISVNDHTQGFRMDGPLTWGTVTGWAAASLSSIAAGAPTTDDMYWRRVVIGTVTTPFKFNKILRS